jgi:hypothetical protein
LLWCISRWGPPWRRPVRPKCSTRFQRLDFHGVRFSISIKMQKSAHDLGLTPFPEKSKLEIRAGFLWIEGPSRHFMLEHKSGCSVVQRLEQVQSF